MEYAASAGLGLEANGTNTINGGDLVVVQGVARPAHYADQHALCIADKDSAWKRPGCH